MSMCNILFVYIYLHYLLNQRWELGCYTCLTTLSETHFQCVRPTLI